MFNGTRTTTESVNTHRRAQIPRTAFFSREIKYQMSRLKRIFFCFVRLINNSLSLSSLRGGISNSKLIRRMFCLLTFECSSFLRAARIFPISSLFVQKCWKFRSFGLSCRAIVGCVRSLASGAVRKWRRGDSRIVLASQLSAFDATGDYP